MTQAFNLSQFANKVNTSGQADLTTAVTGTLPVSNGGTGAATLTSGNVLIGAGTSAVTSVAAGTTGNVLTSNGTTWTSAAATGGQFQTELFTSPGTWTKPASCSQVRVTVIGGGGSFGGPGSAAGGTSSFGPAVSATGGGRAVQAVPNTVNPGTGTVAVGTAIKVGGVLAAAVAASYHASYSIGLISGSVRLSIPGGSGVPGQAFSTTNIYMAGTGANQNVFNASGQSAGGGGGGLAVAIVPVSAPVAITIGAGGNASSPPTSGTGGIGGAILVEFIG